MIDINTALDEMESLFSWGFPKESAMRFPKLVREIVESQVPVTQEQHARIACIGIDVLSKGVSKLGFWPTIDHFSHLLFEAGYRAKEWTKEADHVAPRDTGILPIKFELAVEFLKKIGLLRANADVDLVDYGEFMFPQESGRFRDGVLVLAKRRLFVVGKDHPHEYEFHIMYPDRTRHRFYGSLDYIDFERDDRVEFGRGVFLKHIDIHKKDVRYALKHPRKIYGPLFYRYRLPDGWEVHTGEVHFKIGLEKFKDRHRRKERYLKLLEGIRAGIKSAESQYE